MSRNVNEMSKEDLVRVLVPGATGADGDTTATYSRLMAASLHELRTMYARQIASGILKISDFLAEEDIQAARAQARQIAQNDPQVKAAREQNAKELQEARAKVIAELESVAWQRFFARHSQDPQGALADNAANRAALSVTAISLTKNGVISFEALEEALTIVEKDQQLLRTTPKKPATRENLAADEATLRKYCRDNRLSYGGTSALNALREKYGSGFSGADIAQASQGNPPLIQLKPETDPQILAEWDYQDKVARAKYLRDSASPSELRQAVRDEGARTAQQHQQEQAAHSAKLTAQMQVGYPPLPTHWVDGTPIDRRWLIQTSNKNYQTFRDIVKKYGSANVTARIQGQ
jgi:hypothetical protein